MYVRRAALALALMTLSFAARAESPYPNQPIKFVVPYAAGGFPDTTARIITSHLQGKIGEPAVVENRPGGAGSVAVNALTSSPADGYTLMVTDGSTVTINPRENLGQRNLEAHWRALYPAPGSGAGR